MANPTPPTAATPIASAWGADVTSRVVGIYPSTAAAEADGRVEPGAVVGLNDGSVWVKRTATSGDWSRIHTRHEYATLAAFPGVAVAPTWSSLGTLDIVVDPAASSPAPLDLSTIAVAACVNTTGAGIIIEAQARISTNLGATYNNGPVIPQRIAAGVQGSVVAGHGRKAVTAAGGPPATVRSEVRIRASVAGVDFLAGHHQFMMIPSLA